MQSTAQAMRTPTANGGSQETDTQTQTKEPDMHTHYRAVVEFTSDRPLTEDELDLLGMTLFIQVDEPVDEEGEHAEWSSTGERATVRLAMRSPRVGTGVDA
jgi:hypothetical protein